MMAGFYQGDFPAVSSRVSIGAPDTGAPDSCVLEHGVVGVAQIKYPDVWI
jgi:hypothetical protein